jgi:hypothetical protein
MITKIQDDDGNLGDKRTPAAAKRSAPAKMDSFSLGIFWDSLEKWTPARNVRPNIVLKKCESFSLDEIEKWTPAPA